MDISNFIEIVCAYPSIGNVSSNEYRNRITRNKIYNEILYERKQPYRGIVIPSTFSISSDDLNIITLITIVYDMI